MLFKKIVLFLQLLVSILTLTAQSMYQQFADSEMKRFPEAWQLDHGKRLYFGYSQGLGCLAMLKVAEKTGDKKYFNYVEKWADTLINEKGEIHLYELSAYNVDFVNSGKILFELYEKTKKEKYRLAIETLVHQLKYQPTTLEGGYWHKLIYPHQIWLDGVYMTGPFLAKYAKLSKDDQYYDKAIDEILITAKHTLDPRTGLYYHAWDESKKQAWANPQTGQSPNFWGRSIGWYFMAVIDVLDELPLDYPRRDKLIQLAQSLANTLANYQDDEGLWWQVIDQPKRKGNYQEASVNSMFLYTYSKGINKKHLSESYMALVNKLYQGIQKKLLKQENGLWTLMQCNAVAGLGGNPYRDGSYDYYVGERIRENDTKATGPFIMGCMEAGF
ncbi:glycoside hydrolase family 88/105 protein [Sphingobacterium athyrii]|uniref:Glycoside hydrolase family 88 protein n=1 Tax=Sphingobacterium athyrii TaxID=2152717 RepID=A0A363NS30_9SPHI|nr:glycoside hydrolase family 88 protein [Sphingobacterium athyrii]PUV23615.1 glycoside hydrolase family 88 protein [Sphingobacterium athyrii]